MTRFVTSAPYRPYTHISRPQRVAVRQIMHGSDIRPMNDNLVTMGKRRAWFWTQFAIYSAVTLYALDLWIIH